MKRSSIAALVASLAVAGVGAPATGAAHPPRGAAAWGLLHLRAMIPAPSPRFMDLVGVGAALAFGVLVAALTFWLWNVHVRRDRPALATRSAFVMWVGFVLGLGALTVVLFSQDSAPPSWSPDLPPGTWVQARYQERWVFATVVGATTGGEVVVEADGRRWRCEPEQVRTPSAPWLLAVAGDALLGLSLAMSASLLARAALRRRAEAEAETRRAMHVAVLTVALDAPARARLAAALEPGTRGPRPVAALAGRLRSALKTERAAVHGGAVRLTAAASLEDGRREFDAAAAAAEALAARADDGGRDGGAAPYRSAEGASGFAVLTVVALREGASPGRDAEVDREALPQALEAVLPRGGALRALQVVWAPSDGRAALSTAALAQHLAEVRSGQG